jgi:hypothetical protein
LAAGLSTEISDREVAIDNEASIRLSSDESLESALSAEQARIDAILDGSDVDLDQFAEIVNFVNGIDLENDNALLSAMTSFGADLDAEESRAISAEGSLAADLSSETSARISDVDTEESRAMSAEAVLTNDLSAEVSNRIADVDAEESRAMSAELVLNDAIVAEQSRAESAEASLAEELSYEVSYLIANTDLTAIDSFAEVSNELSNEISSRESADMSLAAELSSEIDGLAATDEATIELDTVGNTIRLKETIAAPASGLRTFEGNVEVSGELTVGGVNVMDEISTEVSRAESTEASLAYDFANIYFRSVGVAETANGTITEFTFNNELRTGSQAVYLNGLLQDAGDYSITPTSVTFANAPLAGDKVAVYGMY